MKWLISLFISLGLLGFPSYSFAKTYAYFIGMEGKVAKLDTDTNTVTANLKIEGGTVLGADRINNYLYISHCIRLGPCKIGVYGLQTLAFIKYLPLESLKEDIQMIIYPDGSKFLINYLLSGGEDKEIEEAGYTIDLYDARKLTEIENVQNFFGMSEVMFSADGKKIYSVDSEDVLYTIDSITFQVLASRDLAQVWRKDIFGARVKHFINGKLLISENLKTEISLPNKLDLYVYDIETQAVSPKISTGLQGDAMFTAGGAKIIFDENEDIRKIKGSKSYLMGFRSLGRLHIYDVATGKELRTISFKAQGKGKVIGIRPAGDRLYYQSEGLTKDTYNVTVINIKDYYVMTTISLPFKAFFVTFFEE